MKKLLLIILLTPHILIANIKDITTYINECNDIKFKNVVISQLKIESNHGKSLKAKKYNNYFGITYSPKSPYQVKNVKGYAVYNRWEDCVLDYIRIQNKILNKYNCLSYKDYINSLIKYKYATDVNYKNLLTKMSYVKNKK